MDAPEPSLSERLQSRMQRELLPLWRSRTLRLAAVAVIAGLAFWIYGRLTGTGDPRPSSLAAVRLAGGYAGGFLIGFALRGITRFALVAAGALLGGLAVLKLTGIFQLDWQGFERQVREGASWTQHQAETARHWATGILPTGFFTGFGLFRGFRCR
ncbi:MAG: hypothetical protein KF791_03235 [Verrucomicrobiae bacterium]|nr:hypothetical protein [Verrucomicrobiae bacterium]